MIVYQEFFEFKISITIKILIMKTEKKKFFFEKDEKVINASNVLEKAQMKKIAGGSVEMRDPSNDRTYAESTYVRR